MKIITVTLNPSLERTLVVHYLATGYHNQTVETSRLDAAGRGVNISRALAALRSNTHAIVLLGDDPNSIAYNALLEAEPFPIRHIRVAGQTRSTIVIWDNGNHVETTIGEDNAGFSIAEVQQVAQAMNELLEPGDKIVFAGPLPAGIEDTIYANMIRQAKEQGAEVILDLPNAALQASLHEQPDLVFMTQAELEAYFNFPVRQQQDVLYCTRKMCEAGAGSVLVALSNDAGAILTTQAGEHRIVEFPENAITGTHSGTIGALLGGFLAASSRQQPIETALELGAAAALYTAQQVGNQFAESMELPEHLKQVHARPIHPDAQPQSE